MATETPMTVEQARESLMLDCGLKHMTPISKHFVQQSCDRLEQAVRRSERAAIMALAEKWRTQSLVGDPDSGDPVGECIEQITRLAEGKTPV